MGDRQISESPARDTADLRVVGDQEGRFSGPSILALASSDQGHSNSQQGRVCREVNGVMVCTNIYADQVKFGADLKAGTDNANAAKPAATNDKTAQPAVYKDSTFELFPWMLPPEKQSAAQTPGLVERVGLTSPAPYYGTSEKSEVYQGPSAVSAAPPEIRMDPYAFHQGAGNPASRVGDTSTQPGAQQSFDPYSFQQGADSRPYSPPVAPVEQIPAPPVKSEDTRPAQPPAEVQKPVCPPGQNCNPQQNQYNPCRPCQPCNPQQNQYNPCRPCQPCRPNGGWYPGKVVGRIFGGGRGRCR